MSFLNPFFLWALTAISIPVIIHLINFRRHKTIYFSNTKYLINIKKETRNKTQLKQLLILLCRILTISMLVIVFAGPYIPNESKVDDSDSVVSVIGIYVDNSFSMQAETKSGQLLEFAKQTALELVNNSDTDMRFILVTNDLKPEHQVMLSKSQVISEINKVDFSSKNITLDNLTDKANTLVPKESSAIFYVLSDMQTNFVSSPIKSIDKNIQLVFIPLRGTILNNIYIDSCYFETPIQRLGQQEKLIVQVVSASEEDNYDVPLQLFINDTLKAVTGVNLKAGERVDVELNYVNTTSGHVSGRLEIIDYPIIYDNALFFNYYIAEKLKILIINGRESNHYLTSLYLSAPDNFLVTNVLQGSEQNLNFSAFDFIILSDISDISSGLSISIKNFVNNGGSICFIPAGEINHKSINDFLKLLNSGNYSYDVFQDLNISHLDYNHDIFKNVFLRIEDKVDLPKLSKLHNYIANKMAAPSFIIKTGNQKPVLISYTGELGNIFVFTTPMTGTNTDFLRHPIFVPVMYNMAFSSQLNNPLYANISNNSEYQIFAREQISNTEIIKITDNTELEIIPQFRFYGNQLTIFLPDELNYAENFDLVSSSSFLGKIAVNYDRSESVPIFVADVDLQYLLEELFGKNVRLITEYDDTIGKSVSDFHQNKTVWRYFLLMALIFILSEILIIRFMK